MIRARRSILLLLLVSVMIPVGSASADVMCVPSSGTFTLYVSQSGDNAHNGCNSSTDAIKDLVRAHQLLVEWQNLGLLGGLDIYVRFTPTDYSDPTKPEYSPWDMGDFMWTFSNSPNHTYFLPLGYTPTAKTSAPNCPPSEPVFRGPAANGHKYWLWVESSTNPSYLDFLCLSLKQYPIGGIHFGGGGSNTVRGVLFYKIGTSYAQGTFTYGLGGLQIDRSPSNYISYNTFDQLENLSPYEGQIHGVYLTNGSSSSTITQNKFTAITGDPIRARNASDGNWITWNDLWATGNKGFYGDWYDVSSECPSHYNHFYNNWTGAPSNKYSGPTHVGFNVSGLPYWFFYDGQSNSYVGPPSNGCSSGGHNRIYTSGNDINPSGASW